MSVQASSDGSSDGAAVEPAPSRRRYYVLALLVALNALLVLDKIVFTILLEPLKHEFGVSDLALGTLAGFVYAVFMGAAALPLGMLADRVNRRNLIVACLVGWSAMTALCGMAQSFVQLLLARIGVGIGEGGGGPGALSIISDLFEHRRRALAMSIFSIGTPISALLNLTIGTRIAHDYGWRVTLFAASAPGFVLGLLMLLTMREPLRGAVDRRRSVSDARSLRETIGFVRGQRSLLHLLAGAVLAYIVLAGSSSWTFSFLVRSHHVRLSDVGLQLGIALCTAGIVGNLAMGFFADRLARRDERWRSWLMAIGACGSVTFGWGFVLVPDWRLVVVLLACWAACAAFWLGPAYGLVQSLVAVRMRGTVGALLFLGANMIGYGFGPLIVGGISDALAPQFGTDSLRVALVLLITMNLWAGLHFGLAARAIRADRARAVAYDEAPATNQTKK